MISRKFLSVMENQHFFRQINVVLSKEVTKELISRNFSAIYNFWLLYILKIHIFLCFSTEIPEDEDYQTCFRNFSYTDPNFWWLFLAPQSIWRKLFLCEIIGKFYQFLIVSLSKEIIFIWLQNSLMYQFSLKYKIIRILNSNCLINHREKRFVWTFIRYSN